MRSASCVSCQRDHVLRIARSLQVGGLIHATPCVVPFRQAPGPEVSKGPGKNVSRHRLSIKSVHHSAPRAYIHTDHTRSQCQQSDARPGRPATLDKLAYNLTARFPVRGVTIIYTIHPSAPSFHPFIHSVIHARASPSSRTDALSGRPALSYLQPMHLSVSTGWLSGHAYQLNRCPPVSTGVGYKRCYIITSLSRVTLFS